MKIHPFLAVPALVLASLARVHAAKLGDPAAPLVLKETVKGEPVDLAAAKGKQVVVVEFWATWCGPCKVSIPHLTQMQAKYKDKGVTFVGVSDEKADIVKPFVAKMGDKMAYVVAVDDERKTSDGYMRAFKQGGIPTAFVVDKEGKIAWVGHPMGGLDEVLEKVVAGKYDIATAQKEMDEREAKQQRMNELNTAFMKYIKLSNDEDASAPEAGAKLVKDVGPEPQILNAIAWNILTAPAFKHRDAKVALLAAEAAVDASKGKDAAILDTYARALADNGKISEAVAQQKKAVGLATDEKLKSELSKTLQGYEAKAATK